MSKTTVNVAFDDDTLNVIDIKKGRISRSAYINDLVSQTLEVPSKEA